MQKHLPLRLEAPFVLILKEYRHSSLSTSPMRSTIKLSLTNNLTSHVGQNFPYTSWNVQAHRSVIVFPFPGRKTVQTVLSSFFFLLIIHWRNTYWMPTCCQIHEAFGIKWWVNKTLTLSSWNLHSNRGNQLHTHKHRKYKIAKFHDRNGNFYVGMGTIGVFDMFWNNFIKRWKSNCSLEDVQEELTKVRAFPVVTTVCIMHCARKVLWKSKIIIKSQWD